MPPFLYSYSIDSTQKTQKNQKYTVRNSAEYIPMNNLKYKQKGFITKENLKYKKDKFDFVLKKKKINCL